MVIADSIRATRTLYRQFQRMDLWIECEMRCCAAKDVHATLQMMEMYVESCRLLQSAGEQLATKLRWSRSVPFRVVLRFDQRYDGTVRYHSSSKPTRTVITLCCLCKTIGSSVNENDGTPIYSSVPAYQTCRTYYIDDSHLLQPLSLSRL